MAGDNSTPYGRVYLVTNLVNGKRYVGQTVMPLAQRWKKHCGMHSGCHALSAAIRKYGEHSFSIEEIASASSAAELNALEAALVIETNSMWPHGYNLKAGGGSVGKMSEATRARMKAATAASWQDEAYRRHQLAQKQTETFKKSLSLAARARWADPEYRAAALQKSGQPEYRKKLGAISAERWSVADYRDRQIARMRSDENVAARRASALAKWQDPEYRARHEEIRNSADFKKSHRAGLMRVMQDPVYKTKMSESKKRHWQNPEMRRAMLKGLEESEGKRVAALRAAYADPALRALKSQQSKELWASEEHKAKMNSPEVKARQRAAAKQTNTPQKAERSSVALKQKWADPEYRAKMMEMIHSPEVKAKRQEALRLRWEKYRAAKAAAQN